MKRTLFGTSTIVAILLASLLFGIGSVFAQEMTKDQWQAEMEKYKAQRTDLQNRLTTLTNEITKLKTESEKLDADVTACEEALFALLGVSRGEFEAFVKEIGDMERRVADLQRMSDAELLNHRGEIEAMNARLGEMAKHKIALIPRFGDRIRTLLDKVSALMKSLQREKTYTVGTWSRDRDCLWNIAKKKNIYDNAWLWPKIWQGNRDKIKDPDVIQPRWVLRIPEGTELTRDERSAANSYYRKKAAAPTP